MTNTNTLTGVAFGYISANALDYDVVDQLMHGKQATDHSYQEALINERPIFEDEFGRSLRDDALDSAMEFYERRFADDYQCEEPEITGTFEGVKYASSWLGGALNFWIFQSPFTTDKARRASPCVPGAGILDTLDGSETSYDVPPEWRAEDV